MPDPGLKFGNFFSRPVLKFAILAYLHQLSFTIFIFKSKIIFWIIFKIIKHSVRGGKVGEAGLFIENKMSIGHHLGFKIPSSRSL